MGSEMCIRDRDGEDLFGIKDKAKTIGQMKNIAQEKDIIIKDNKEVKTEVNLINSFDDLLKTCSFKKEISSIETNPNLINSFDDLLKTCFSKKEIKLKYELEKNVNPVSYTHLTLPTTPYV